MLVNVILISSNGGMMVITINIYYTGTDNNLRLFMNEMISNGIVDRIRKQPGNLKYEYFIPFEEEGKILLIDQWSSQQALDVHHQSPMMQEIIELRNKYELEMEVERFANDNISITSNDRKYIK